MKDFQPLCCICRKEHADPTIYVGIRNPTNYTLHRWFCRSCAEQIARELGQELEAAEPLST